MKEYTFLYESGYCPTIVLLAGMAAISPNIPAVGGVLTLCGKTGEAA